MKTAAIIGSGKLATQLAPALQQSGLLHFKYVYSRSLKNAALLANTLEADYGCKAGDIPLGLDYYFLCLTDDANKSFLTQIPHLSGEAFILCSGSLPLSIFKDFTPKKGIFYPIQSFSKVKKARFKEIPIGLYSETTSIMEDLENWAKRLQTFLFFPLKPEKRLPLHIAAVFACNFANYMWVLAEKIMNEEGMDSAILQPLMQETLNNAMNMGATNSITGPAVRGDQTTIQKHLTYLQSEERKELYRKISEGINPKLKGNH